MDVHGCIILKEWHHNETLLGTWRFFKMSKHTFSCNFFSFFVPLFDFLIISRSMFLKESFGFYDPWLAAAAATMLEELSWLGEREMEE